MPEKRGALSETFRADGRIVPLLVYLYVAINWLVLVNCALHAPLIGYDTPQHLNNVRALARLEWPTPQQSSEFFSPPLPYLLPALASAAGASAWVTSKVGQLVNVLLSLALTYALLRLCDVSFPGRTRVKVVALGVLGMLPVYYKSFSQMRGEPYVACLAVIAAVLAVQIFVRGRTTAGNVALLGASLGLAVLARQWGFFLFPPVVAIGVLGVARAEQPRRWRVASSLVAALALSAVVGGWFYAHLAVRYGTVAAFNRKPGAAEHERPFALWARGDWKVFTDPVRPTLGDRLLPILYSDVWGDYHGYFSIYALDRTTWTYLPGNAMEAATKSGSAPRWIDTNRFTFNRYLGWVDRVSLLPTLLLLAGAVYGASRLLLLRRRSDPSLVGVGLAALVTVVSAAGYLWFVRTYPNPGNGDTIKATYLLYVYPFLAFQAAALLDRVRVRRFHVALGLALLAITIFNLPAMVTHFIELP
jgi:hypothetical protein